MKLSTQKFNELRKSVERKVTSLMETMITDTMDNEFRDDVMNGLPVDWTEDEIDEVREKWEDFDDEEGNFDESYTKFIQGLVDVTMSKYNK
jgi:hypothetical protein